MVSKLAQLLDTYKNGRRVRDRLYGWERDAGKIAREGEIFGTALGGAVKRNPGTNRPCLTVNVKWDDGTESATHHTALEVIDY